MLTAASWLFAKSLGAAGESVEFAGEYAIARVRLLSVGCGNEISG